MSSVSGNSEPLYNRAWRRSREKMRVSIMKRLADKKRLTGKPCIFDGDVCDVPEMACSADFFGFMAIGGESEVIWQCPRMKPDMPVSRLRGRQSEADVVFGFFTGLGTTLGTELAKLLVAYAKERTNHVRVRSQDGRLARALENRYIQRKKMQSKNVRRMVDDLLDREYTYDTLLLARFLTKIIDRLDEIKRKLESIEEAIQKK